jgi:hypothetical protein
MHNSDIAVSKGIDVTPPKTTPAVPIILETKGPINTVLLNIRLLKLLFQQTYRLRP